MVWCNTQDRGVFATVPSTRIRHPGWKDKFALAVLLGLHDHSKPALRFPIVRQRIAVFLLQAGVQRQFVACVALGVAWRLAKWPRSLQVEHPTPMSRWQGVKQTEGGYLRQLGHDLGTLELDGSFVHRSVVYRILAGLVKPKSSSIHRLCVNSKSGDTSSCALHLWDVST